VAPVGIGGVLSLPPDIFVRPEEPGDQPQRRPDMQEMADFADGFGHGGHDCSGGEVGDHLVDGGSGERGRPARFDGRTGDRREAGQTGNERIPPTGSVDRGLLRGVNHLDCLDGRLWTSLFRRDDRAVHRRRALCEDGRVRRRIEI
jgi:hypothetical protein